MIKRQILLGLIAVALMTVLTACLGGGRVPAPLTFSVSGRVTADDDGLAGVTLQFSGPFGSAITGDDGSWSKSGLSGKVTVTPSLDGWRFTPEIQELTQGNSVVEFVGNRLDADEEPITGAVIDARSRVLTLSLSPDGRRLASGHVDESVRVWDLAQQKLLFKLDGHLDWVRAVAYSPKGDLIASSSDDNDVLIWGAHTGELVHTLKGHEDWVRTVAFSFDGARVASGDDDNTIRIWDPVLGTEVAKLQSGSEYVWIYTLDFAPDAFVLASGDYDGNVNIWDVEQGILLKNLTDDAVTEVYSVAFSPDGSMLAAGGEGGSVVIWHAATYEEVSRIEGLPGDVEALAFSPDADMLATAVEGDVFLWDVASGILRAKLAGSFDINAVQFLPSGDYVVTGDDDGMIKIWDLNEVQWELL